MQQSKLYSPLSDSTALFPSAMGAGLGGVACESDPGLSVAGQILFGG